MNKTMLSTALLATLTLAACTTVPSANMTNVLANATLKNSAGQSIGSAKILQSGQALLLMANVTGQSPGEHGIHLHATGKCEAPGFTSAGGHLNPTAYQHGNLNPAGPHAGDLPNILVASDGAGAIETQITGASATALANFFDVDGTAIVVHAGPDDYKTDPSGNSGGRIACGVLVREAE